MGGALRSFSLPMNLLPNKFVAIFTEFSESQRYFIKTQYANHPLIYAWLNTTNGKLYVGKTLNPKSRFKQYFYISYLKANKNKMAICSALLKYGYINFHLYILELCDSQLSKTDFSLREDYWYTIIKPSYNIQKIIQPFVGENHYRFGKTVSQEVRDKISKSLKNRTVSEIARINHSLGAKKRKVYCYDAKTGEFVMFFTGIKVMVREVNLSNNNIIYARLDKGKPLNCTYGGVERSWVLYSNPLNNNGA